MKNGSNFKNLGIIRISLDEILNKQDINKFIASNLTDSDDVIKLQTEMKLTNKNITFHLQATVINILGSIPQNQ